jgi:hypothetical protein
VSGRAHLVVVAVTVLAVVFVLRLVRTRQIRSKYGLLWLTICALMLGFALFPGLLDRLSRTLGVHYPPTTFLLLAVGFVFVVIVHYSWELSRTETRLRTLAEELSLLKAAIELRDHDPAADDPDRSPGDG